MPIKKVERINIRKLKNGLLIEVYDDASSFARPVDEWFARDREDVVDFLRKTILP